MIRNWFLILCIVGLIAANSYSGGTPAPTVQPGGSPKSAPGTSGGTLAGGPVLLAPGSNTSQGTIFTTNTLPTTIYPIPIAQTITTSGGVTGGTTAGGTGGGVGSSGSGSAATTPGGGTGGNPPGAKKYTDVEPLMCDIQMRWHYQYLTEDRFCQPYIQWGCTPCGITIPPFPANDVIDESDPVVFVRWVRTIVQKFYSAQHLICVDSGVYGSYYMAYSFAKEYEGESQFVGDYHPQGNAKCKIPSNRDYVNEAPYTEGTSELDETATVHLGNANDWITLIRSHLADMVRIQINTSVSSGWGKSGYGYASSGSGGGNSANEAWAEAEEMANETWGEDGFSGPMMYGYKGAYIDCYDSSEYGYSEYRSFEVGIKNSEASVYQVFDIDGDDYFATKGYSSDRTGVSTKIKILHMLGALKDGVAFPPKFPVDNTYRVYASITSDEVLNRPEYENTWEKPSPSAIPNPDCECVVWDEYSYDDGNGGTVTERYSSNWADKEVGWTLANPPDIWNRPGRVALLYPDFTVPATWKQSNPAGCKNGRCPKGGNGSHNNSCLMSTYSLGKTPDGQAIGGMNLYGQVPSPRLATPRGLSIEFNPDVNTQKEIKYDANGMPRQIKTVSELIDINISPSNKYKYTIKRYELEHIDLNQVNGLYPILSGHEDDWTWEYTFENPDYNPSADDPETEDIDEGLTDYNRLIITEVFEGQVGNAKCYLYDYEESSKTWRLGHDYDRVASGPAWDFSSQVASRWEIVQESNEGKLAVRKVLDQDFNVLSTSSATYEKIAGQYILVSATFADSPNQTYRNVYYDDIVRDGAALYGKLRYTVDISGYWRRYEYDEQGACVKIVEQIGNLPITAPEEQCKVTVAIEDGWSITYEGIEVARWFEVYDAPVDGFRTIRNIQCTKPGSTVDDPSNFVTTTKLYFGGDRDGEVHSITYPDGKVYASLSAETTNGDGSITSTNYSGTPNDPSNPTAIIKGTKSESFTDSQGRSVWYKTYDIETNVLLSHTVNDTFDEFGRVLQSSDMLRGTYTTSSYGCCNLDATTDELGITTTYGYDAFSRMETVTRNGITSYTTYDSMNRPTSQSRIGSDDRAILQGSVEYDLLGRVISSTDVSGNITTYAYTRDDELRHVTTTTNPDGSTVVATYNQDGTLYKSSGTATVTTIYESGTAAAPIENSPVLWYSKVSHLGDDGQYKQWEMTFTDMLGRTVCTVYSDDTPADLTDNPIARLYYDDTTGSGGGAGRLVKQVDPDGITTLYAYNADGQQNVTAIDLNANGIIDYDTDRITKSDSMLLTAGTVDNSVPVRRSESYVWTASDLTSTDGTLTSYTESSIDGMQSWSVTLVGGGIELITHTQTTLDRATRTQTTTTTNFDGSYSVSITTDGQLQSTTSFDANDVILTQQTYSYDAHGRQYAVTDLRTAASGSTTYTYNDADQIVAITMVDPDQTDSSNGPLSAQVTRFTYDKMGRQSVITLPDGNTQHRKYDLRGQLVASWGADGYPVEYTYDTQGRRKTLTTWKDFDQVAGKGITGKAVTTWHYDPYRGHMTSKTYDDGKGTSYTYSAAGRLLTRTWQRGITTTYGYDPAGQLITVDYSDSTQDITYTYDRLGRSNTTLDAAGLTSYAYVDAYNALVTNMTVTPGSSVPGGPGSSDTLAGTSVSYVYDSLYRRAGINAGRLINDVMTTYTTTGYTYDAASRLKSVTDGINYATYNYLANSGNMIDNIQYAVDTTVGANDDGIAAPTPEGAMFTTTKQYDQLGRFVSHASVRDADSTVLSSYGYTYNPRGQRAQAHMTDGSYWDYQYDHLGQLTGAAKFTSAGKILPGYQYNYQYDQIGNRTQTHAGGDALGTNLRQTNYQSNTLNQYTQINNHPYANVTGQAHADATVTVQLEENAPATALKPGGFNPRDNATDVEKRTAQTARVPIPDSDDAYFHAEFEVDTTSGGTNGARSELDLTVTGIRNGQGPNGEDAIDTKNITRQIPASTVMLTYDDDGNLTSDDRWTYIWNGENRLIELQPKPIYRVDGEILTKRLEFTYDSEGRRIEKRVYAYNAVSQQHDTLESITRFIYDGWLLIAELTKPVDEQLPGGESAGYPLRTYTHGLDLSGSMEGAGGIAGLLFMTTFDPTSHDREGVVAFTYDGNGNVIDLVNIPTPTEVTSGTLAQVTANYKYSPFGQLIQSTGTATETNPFMFSTKYTDEETGFCYYGYRYYDAMMGRWLNRDPIQESGGVCVYLISCNNPILMIDGLGLIHYSFNPNPPVAESPRPGSKIYDSYDFYTTWSAYAQLFDFYTRIHYYYWPDGTSAEWVYLSGAFLSQIKDEREVKGFNSDVSKFLYGDAMFMKEYLHHMGDTATFDDAGHRVVCSYKPNVRISLQRFSLYWFADCAIGPKQDDNGDGKGCRADYKCKINWVLYDLYDFAVITFKYIGQPFHIRAEWDEEVTGTVYFNN